ncbi:MAG: hypothetical protein QOG92_235, partial [Verrucomicrobiota bacterium]|nr:hypothetical protein [Verrucomicrobiota bacterium]
KLAEGLGPQARFMQKYQDIHDNEKNKHNTKEL